MALTKDYNLLVKKIKKTIMNTKKNILVDKIREVNEQSNKIDEGEIAKINEEAMEEYRRNKNNLNDIDDNKIDKNPEAVNSDNRDKLDENDNSNKDENNLEANNASDLVSILLVW